ncbi:replication initiator protein [Microviridae sp.]|nr:replication initiator protein [Microviridae sp.]
MACYSPLQAFRTAKGEVVFEQPRGCFSIPLTLPCGQCVGCRLERSRQWAIRCVHEASLHKNNCFITLTFSNEHLPNPPTLDVRDFQLFMKRLRKEFGPGVRFYHCGEYGEKFGRPHYHAILFNLDFPDKYLFNVVNGQNLYRSPTLERLWPFGHSSIGSVTFESAAYVARYVMKKITGDAAKQYYSYCPKTGEVFERKPEYTTMSRRPGIAKGWFDKFLTDVFPSDEVVLRGKSMKPPKYYDNQYEIVYPDEYVKMKQERMARAKERASDVNAPSLESQRICTEAKLKKLVRNVD